MSGTTVVASVHDLEALDNGAAGFRVVVHIAHTDLDAILDTLEAREMRPHAMTISGLREPTLAAAPPREQVVDVLPTLATARLGDLEALSELAALDIWVAVLGPSTLAGLTALLARGALADLSLHNVAAPHQDWLRWMTEPLGNLQALRMTYCASLSGALPIAALADNASLEALETLHLTHCSLDNEAAEALAHSETLPHLKALDLRGNAISKQGALAFAEAPASARLRLLDLRFNAVPETGMRTIDASPHLSATIKHINRGRGVAVQLDEVDLNEAFGELRTLVHRPPSEQAWRDLLEAIDAIPDDQLDATIMRYVAEHLARGWPDALRAADEEWIVDIPREFKLARFLVIRTISFRNQPHRASSAKAIARSPFFANLRDLDLVGNKGGNYAAEAIAHSAHLAGLEALGLSRTGLGLKGVRALVDSANLPALRSLDMLFNAIGVRALDALLESALLTRLEHLAMSFDALSPDDLVAAIVAEAPNLRTLTIGTRGHHHPTLAVFASTVQAHPHFETLAFQESYHFHTYLRLDRDAIVDAL